MNTQKSKPIWQTGLSAIIIWVMVFGMLAVKPASTTPIIEPEVWAALNAPGAPAAPAAPAAEWAPIVAPFQCATAADWLLFGSAELTGDGSPDPVCAGWLRLTPAVLHQAGTAVYNVPIPTDESFVATFQYATYGGPDNERADGFSFYLIDGATANPTIGGSGSSLGYTYNTVTILQPGVTNGYVGIGFDELGNFSVDGGSGGPGFTPQSVVVRGSGNLMTGFNYLTGVSILNTFGQTLDNLPRANARWVRIFVANGLITVQMDFGAGWQTVINQYNLTTAPGQSALPDTFKVGFSAATGWYVNYHEIRNLTIAKPANVNVSVNAVPMTAGPGDSVVITATVTNDAINDVTGLTVSAPVPARLSNATWTCSASAGSSCGAASGIGAISDTANLLRDGALTYVIAGEIGPGAGDLVHTTSAALPPAYINVGEVADSVTIAIVEAPPELQVSGEVTYTGHYPPILVAPALTIIEGISPTLDAARVYIDDNFDAANDRLGIQGTAGVSGTLGAIAWSYNITSGVLSLDGVDTIANYQAALRAVTYDNLGRPTTPTTRTVEFSLGSAPAFPVTGHFYEYVHAVDIWWSQARDAAAARTYFGLQGYLATILSAEENAFANEKLNGQPAWLGASDAAVEGEWRWVTGPEAGLLFCSGPTSACTPVAGGYTNWNTNEPNNVTSPDLPGGEDYLQFIGGTNGRWNDLPDFPYWADWDVRAVGYVVEYGGMPGDPDLAITGQVLVHVLPNTDLALSKTAEDVNGPPLYVNDTIRYTLRVTNTGAITHTNVIVTDTLPAGVTFDSATPAGYSGSNPLVWNVGNLAPGANWTGVILVHVNGSVTPIGGNHAQVSSDQQGPLSVGPVLPPGGGDVIMNSPPEAQDDVYTIPENVAGRPVSVFDVLVNDTDPEAASLSIVAVGTPAHGAATIAGATIIYTPTVGYLGIDTFTYTISDGIAQATAQVTVTVLPVADLAVEQTVRGTLDFGRQLTLVARNLGPRPAHGAVISDTFPNNLVNVTWTCVAAGGAACPNASGSGDLAETLVPFPSGGVVTYTVRADVPSFVGRNNTVSIAPPAGVFDLVMSNNSVTRQTLYVIIFPVAYKNYTAAP